MSRHITKAHLFYAGVIFLCMFLGVGNMLGSGQMAFAIVFGVIVAALSFFYPAVPLYILIIGIPLESKTEVLNLGKAFNFMNIMLFLMFSGWVLRSAIRKDRFILKTPLNVSIGIYMLISVFSYLHGYIRFDFDLMGDTMTAFKQTIMFFVLFFFALNCVRTKKEMAIGLALIGLMTFYETTLAVRQYRQVEHTTYQDESRVVGTFGGKKDSVVGANEMGTFIAQYSALFLAGILVFRKPLTKAVFIGCYSIAGLSAMYTFSRSAYVSMIIAAGATVVFRNRRLIFPFIVVGFLVMLVAPGPVRERFTSIRYEDQSIVTRKNIWADTRHLMVGSPLIGYGYSASSHLLNRDTHNMYYDIGLEMGIPAVFLLFYILYRVYKMTRQIYRHGSDPLEEYVAISLFGSLVALVFCNYFGTRLHFFPINGHFAIMLGIAGRMYFAKGLNP